MVRDDGVYLVAAAPLELVLLPGGLAAGRVVSRLLPLCELTETSGVICVPSSMSNDLAAGHSAVAAEAVCQTVAAAAPVAMSA